MVILGKRGLSAVVKYMLDVSLAGGAIILLSLPVSLRWCFDVYFWTTGENYWFLLAFLMITGSFALVLVYELREMFKNLNNRDPFKRENVANLNKIALMALLISATYMIKIVLYISFLTIIVAIAFLIMSLFSYILAEVFRQAVEVKEENDLTI